MVTDVMLANTWREIAKRLQMLQENGVCSCRSLLTFYTLWKHSCKQTISLLLLLKWILKAIVAHEFYGALWCWCWNVSLKISHWGLNVTFFAFSEKTRVRYFLNHKSTYWRKLMKMEDTKWACSRFILLFEFWKKLQPFSLKSDLESSKNSPSHCIMSCLKRWKWLPLGLSLNWTYTF